MRYIRMTPAADDEAFTVVPAADLAAHLRLDEADAAELALLGGFLRAAVARIDGRTGTLNQAVVTGAFQALACGPRLAGGGFTLDFWTVRSVGKVERLVAGAYVEVPAEVWEWRSADPSQPWSAIVRPRAGRSWPSGDRDEEAFRITFTAGFGPEGTLAQRLAGIPRDIVLAITLRAAWFYENRGGSNPGGEPPAIEALLQNYRRVGL